MKNCTSLSSHPFFLLICLVFFFSSCQQPTPPIHTEQYDVIVLGQGTGAVSAAIQSARSGARTLLVNPIEWLGGMLTAAGVSATDGNHRLPAGLWGEFREQLWQHYGGADSVFTGWVSNTMFEPKVGAQIWSKLAAKETQLEVLWQTSWGQIERKEAWRVQLQLADGTQKWVAGSVLIDGTDLGDVAARVGAGFDVGMDSREASGETMALDSANTIVQDLTYAVILKDYGEQADKSIPKPAGYDPSVFRCACQSPACQKEDPHPCPKMLSYGQLPNGKYMINWPKSGNDYYANVMELTPQERQAVYDKAKLHSLRFVYYIQQELGYKNLGLAEDEFPTPDLLPFYPYHREGRRIHGLSRLNIQAILKPYDFTLYRTGIAVGDYPIDHHHAEYPDAPEIDFPKVPSFNIPLGALIPKSVDHLLIADKAISVSNIVNGSSRLQPVIIQIGQVAGLTAALAAKQQTSPAELDIRQVQEALLKAKCYLLPFIDVAPDHPHFEAIQKIGATGILQGRGIPFQWANQTWFYPDTSISEQNLLAGMLQFEPSIEGQMTAGSAALTIQQCLIFIQTFAKALNQKQVYFESETSLTNYLRQNWRTFKLNHFDLKRKISKQEIAVLLDQLIDPFHLKKVTHSGQWKKE